VGMAEEIVALLRLFERHASDPETHRWVVGLAADPAKWPDAHRVFDEVRRRLLATSDSMRQGQYAFEEICLKTLYNQTAAIDPFDSDAAYYVVPCAIGRARQVGVPVHRVLDIVAPGS
jgi:hypothetical protein